MVYQSLGEYNLKHNLSEVKGKWHRQADPYVTEPLPKEKEYSIILDGKSQPKAVIQTITVDEIAFCDVPADFAYLEGEDDRSLAQWRYAHLNYFHEVFHTYGLTFTEKEILYCETFRVCYRA
ncbi:ASCH domain-containing protein [Enterococcus faecalis]